MTRETETHQQQLSYTVKDLVHVNPYNPDILSDIENYVNEQVSSQTYSLDANLCLLRFYQFEPERMSIQIVAKILIKALMAMPAPDFSLCLFLIPEQVQMEEQFKTLIVLSHYLETARFRQFWDEAAKNRNILEVVPGFELAIQNYAIHVLSLTYQKMPRPVLAEIFLDHKHQPHIYILVMAGPIRFRDHATIWGFLENTIPFFFLLLICLGILQAINIEGPSLDKFLEYQIAKSGWALQKGQGHAELVILPRSEYNHPELKKNTADSMPLEHVTKIFPILG